MTQSLTTTSFPIARGKIAETSFQHPMNHRVLKVRKFFLPPPESVLNSSFDGLTLSSKGASSGTMREPRKLIEISNQYYNQLAKSALLKGLLEPTKKKNIFQKEIRGQIKHHNKNLLYIRSRADNLDKYLDAIGTKDSQIIFCLKTVKTNFNKKVLDVARCNKLSTQIILIDYIVGEGKFQKQQIESLELPDLFETAFKCFKCTDKYQLEVLEICGVSCTKKVFDLVSRKFKIDNEINELAAKVCQLKNLASIQLASTTD